VSGEMEALPTAGNSRLHEQYHRKDDIVQLQHRLNLLEKEFDLSMINEENILLRQALQSTKVCRVLHVTHHPYACYSFGVEHLHRLT
jgi:hypothetical protein